MSAVMCVRPMATGVPSVFKLIRRAAVSREDETHFR